MIKVDLHVHTCCSADSLTLLEHVVLYARRRGLGAVAVTDHNTIQGALRLRRMTGFPIIVGEEIRSTGGEITGLFLEEEIPAGLSPRETVHRIRAQGGIAYIPHPLDRFRGSALEPSALREVIHEVHAVEVLNARNTLAADNRLATALVERYRLLTTAGSDAHHALEIGRAYVEMPPFTGRDSFLAALAEGTVRGHLSWPLVHVASTYAKVAKNLREQRLFAR